MQQTWDVASGREIFVEKLRKPEDLGVGGRIILKLLLDTENMMFWTGFNLLRAIATGFCEYDNGLPCSVTCGKFID
jgi:hypothetical protein